MCGGGGGGVRGLQLFECFCSFQVVVVKVEELNSNHLAIRKWNHLAIRKWKT